MTNEDRADAGEAALTAFTYRTYGQRAPTDLHPDDVFCATYDLICDLGHYLRRYAERHHTSPPVNFNLETAIGCAMRHYNIESKWTWTDEYGDE